eukprot:1360840-Rhodomonas_salina.2
MHHSLLGHILSTRDGLTDPEARVRTFLQIRGNSYPTASVVSRNKKGGVSFTCPLCHEGDETASHMLMHCTATEAARHSAHYCIADPLLTSLAQSSEVDWQMWLRPVTSCLENFLLPPLCLPPPSLSRRMGSRLPSQYYGTGVPPMATRE